ncbi:hypothetical protein Lalb_Chr22g0349551 [Lupinus albus]|uniref:Uncharacterized protein n=1 Tax=Lupinus albus TaxID=3870 RepID=A0A6A4NDG6_LUPAL|nr:hypothetical protein Lalb_Chr22g0349551 [Lupinus albus]
MISIASLKLMVMLISSFSISLSPAHESPHSFKSLPIFLRIFTCMYTLDVPHQAN